MNQISDINMAKGIPMADINNITIKMGVRTIALNPIKAVCQGVFSALDDDSWKVRGNKLTSTRANATMAMNEYINQLIVNAIGE